MCVLDVMFACVGVFAYALGLAAGAAVIAAAEAEAEARRLRVCVLVSLYEHERVWARTRAHVFPCAYSCAFLGLGK